MKLIISAIAVALCLCLSGTAGVIDVEGFVYSGHTNYGSATVLLPAGELIEVRLDLVSLGPTTTVSIVQRFPVSTETARTIFSGSISNVDVRLSPAIEVVSLNSGGAFTNVWPISTVSGDSLYVYVTNAVATSTNLRYRVVTRLKTDQ